MAVRDEEGSDGHEGRLNADGAKPKQSRPASPRHG